MLARVVASVALVFVWPTFPAIAEADGPYLLPEIVVAAGPHSVDGQRREIAAETQMPLLKSGDAAAPAERLQAAEPNTPAASETVLAMEEPFGLPAEPVATGEILAKWDGVEAQIEAENKILARCRNGGAWCPRAARRFLAIVNDGRARNGRARIGVINREINLSIVPTSDLAHWGVADRWSAPLETFAARRGDCEDYAIAKYVALAAAGVPEPDLRLIVVRNNAASAQHAVVAVRLDGDWLILDNRWLPLVRDHAMWRATPLFELDKNGVRRFVTPARAKLHAASSGAS